MGLFQIVESSDLVATVPRDLAQFFVARGKVKMLEIPLKAPVIDVHLIWHQRFHKDLAHVWLRSSIHQVLG